jgi:hypothetical protein
VASVTMWHWWSRGVSWTSRTARSWPTDA